MKSTVVDESLSSFKPMYCSREYHTSTRLIQQYEKSTLNKFNICSSTFKMYLPGGRFSVPILPQMTYIYSLIIEPTYGSWSCLLISVIIFFIVITSEVYLICLLIELYLADATCLLNYCMQVAFSCLFYHFKIKINNIEVYNTLIFLFI